MLIKRAVLDRIVAGEIDTLFRRQRRPTVRTGGTLRTAVGVLAIEEVEQVDVAAIGADDVRRAGFPDLDALLGDLVDKPDAEVYRVRVGLAGADPRLELRDDADLADADVAEIGRRLDRYDAASRSGPWTRRFLELIGERPRVRAPDLAASIGWETAPFKTNVRKLKGLGLTISHSPGYELSPRGRAYLEREGGRAAG